MDDEKVESLAAEASRRIALAKSRLAEEMTACGLRREDGWRIVEELRNTVEGTQWTFRPVHIKLDSPELFATVVIDPDGKPL
jgi:hypothetical protein